MHRLRRALYLLAASLVVISIAALVRTLTAFGTFSSFVPKSAGTCVAVPGVIAATDIKADSVSGLAFVATESGLYTFKSVQPEKGATKLAGTPPDFRASALSLFPAGDGKLTLMALGRAGRAAFAVRIFDVVASGSTMRLGERAEITGGLLIDPAFIAAAGPDQFYVTNEHTSRTRLGRALEDWLLLPRANLVYFDGNFFREVGNDLSFARGIALAADGSTAYVASTSSRAIDVFIRNPFDGRLEASTSFALPSGPDALDMDSNGQLLVAAHPKLADLTASSLAPTQIFEVTLSKDVPVDAKLIYGNDGHEISAASAVASTGARFVIAAHSGVLSCPMPPG